MSILTTDLIAYAAASMPSDDTSTNGGAIDLTRRVVFTNVIGTASVAKVNSDGVDTRTVTITGRLATGILDTEVLTLNGVTVVTGVKTWERIEKVEASATNATRTVTITDATPTTIGTIPINEIGFQAMFISAASDPTVTQTRYMKFFFKNTNATLSLLAAKVQLKVDASALLTVAVMGTINDTTTSANRMTAITGAGTFQGVGVDIAVTGTDLAAGAAIGVVVKQLLAIGNAAQKNTFQMQISGQSV